MGFGRLAVDDDGEDDEEDEGGDNKPVQGAFGCGGGDDSGGGGGGGPIDLGGVGGGGDGELASSTSNSGGGGLMNRNRINFFMRQSSWWWRYLNLHEVFLTPLWPQTESSCSTSFIRLDGTATRALVGRLLAAFIYTCLRVFCSWTSKSRRALGRNLVKINRVDFSIYEDLFEAGHLFFRLNPCLKVVYILAMMESTLPAEKVLSKNIFNVVEQS